MGGIAVRNQTAAFIPELDKRELRRIVAAWNPQEIYLTSELSEGDYTITLSYKDAAGELFRLCQGSAGVGKGAEQRALANLKLSCLALVPPAQSAKPASDMPKTPPRPLWITNPNPAHYVGWSECLENKPFAVSQAAERARAEIVRAACGPEAQEGAVQGSERVDIYYETCEPNARVFVLVNSHSVQCSNGKWREYNFTKKHWEDVRVSPKPEEEAPETLPLKIGKDIQKTIKEACQKEDARSLETCVEFVTADMMQAVRRVCESNEEGASQGDCAQALLEKLWVNPYQLAKLPAGQKMPKFVQNLKFNPLKASDGTTHSGLLGLIQAEAKRNKNAIKN